MDDESNRPLSARLVSALGLWVQYSHAGWCFNVFVFQWMLKCALVLYVILKVDGLWVSAILLLAGVFAIDCFGPRGRDKARAIEFGRLLVGTLKK